MKCEDGWYKGPLSMTAIGSGLLDKSNAFNTNNYIILFALERGEDKKGRKIRVNIE